jgi:hypothetical protein
MHSAVVSTVIQDAHAPLALTPAQARSGIKIPGSIKEV